MLLKRRLPANGSRCGSGVRKGIVLRWLYGRSVYLKEPRQQLGALRLRECVDRLTDLLGSPLQTLLVHVHAAVRANHVAETQPDRESFQKSFMAARVRWDCPQGRAGVRIAR